jgi:uncharacterized membrane protein HdeD (DUF308 family)
MMQEFLNGLSDKELSQFKMIGFAVLTIGILLMCLPIVVSFISSRFWHILLASLFCLLSVLVGVTSVYVPYLAVFYVPILGGSFWTIGLMFGIAASIDAMAERRMKREQRRQINEQRDWGNQR